MKSSLYDDMWPHQKEAFDFAVGKYGTFFHMDMGTGKTLVAIGLMNEWGVNSVLVLCPQVVINVWRRELTQWLGDEGFIASFANPRKSIIRRLDDINMVLGLQGDAAAKGVPIVIVVNYEMSRSHEFRNVILGKRWDLVVLDESHRAKGPQSNVSKFVGQLHDRARFRLCLTGTPMPHSILDVFGQYRFLDQLVFGGLGYRPWMRFRDQFAVTAPITGTQARMVVGYRNKRLLAQMLRPTLFRVTSDILSLPEATDTIIELEMKPAPQKLYRQLRDDLCVKLASGVVAPSNTLVHLLRLQQMASGFCKTEEGDEQQVSSHKEDALKDLLEDIPKDDSVVVFCRFRSELRRVNQVAEILGRRYCELSGERKDLTPNATMEGFFGQVLGVQIQAGGLGVDLTQARHAVYWSHGWSLGDYEQSRARLVRPGQKHSVSFHHLITVDTEDVNVYKSLAAKKEPINEVTRLLLDPPSHVDDCLWAQNEKRGGVG